METTFIEYLWGGIQIILESINWVFVPIFVTCMWLFNESIENNENERKSWIVEAIKAIPRTWRVILGGIVLSIPFIWFYDLFSKEGIASMVYSIFISMIMWKMGIDDIFEWFKNKIWKALFPKRSI